MCEIIGPGSLSIKDQEKDYFLGGQSIVPLELVDLINKGLDKGKQTKTKTIEVKNGYY